MIATSPRNSAEFGAAVFADVNCAGIFKNTTFSENAADEDGGAIHITGSGVIGVADCNITKNTAIRGGGIFTLSSPQVIIIDCQINFNKAYKDGFICEGGGIYSFDGLALIENCRINDNNSNTSGGGIYVSGESEPNIHNCLITNNIANRDGGGVSANWYAQLTLSNCTIANNCYHRRRFASVLRRRLKLCL